jgi:hypothetical protein
MQSAWLRRSRASRLTTWSGSAAHVGGCSRRAPLRRALDLLATSPRPTVGQTAEGGGGQLLVHIVSVRSGSVVLSAAPAVASANRSTRHRRRTRGHVPRAVSGWLTLVAGVVTHCAAPAWPDSDAGQQPGGLQGDPRSSSSRCRCDPDRRRNRPACRPHRRRDGTAPTIGSGLRCRPPRPLGRRRGRRPPSPRRRTSASRRTDAAHCAQTARSNRAPVGTDSGTERWSALGEVRHEVPPAPSAATGSPAWGELPPTDPKRTPHRPRRSTARDRSPMGESITVPAHGPSCAPAGYRRTTGQCSHVMRSLDHEGCAMSDSRRLTEQLRRPQVRPAWQRGVHVIEFGVRPGMRLTAAASTHPQQQHPNPYRPMLIAPVLPARQPPPLDRGSVPSGRWGSPRPS